MSRGAVETEARRHPFKDSAYRILITPASGFAGRAVLEQCLRDYRIGAVTSVGRRSLGLAHPKLTEVIHTNFLDQSTIAGRYEGLDAVYFCLGISQSDVREEWHYREITYDYTMETARRLEVASPQAVFHFLSGAGTNVDGRFMWARVKGVAERDLSVRDRSDPATEWSGCFVRWSSCTSPSEESRSVRGSPVGR